MKKRILALVLSVAMVLGAVSFTAFADAAAGANYAAGEGAYYLLDVPEAGIGAENHTTSGTTEALPVVSENGEQFINFANPYQFDAETNLQNYTSLINVTKLTYGADGIPSSIAFGDGNAETTEDLANTYLAVRMKINDNRVGYVQEGSSIGFNFVKTTIDPETEEIGRAATVYGGSQHLRWLDLTDGSMGYFRAQSGYNRQSNADRIDFTGDMDGYLLIPFTPVISGEKNMIFTEADLRKELAGLEITFFNSAPTEDDKATDWLNKQVLIGDMFIVNDAEKFAAARSAKRGVAGQMYRPNVEDTAIYAARVGGYRSYLFARHSTTVSSKYLDPSARGGVGNYDTVNHVTTLPNGDRAYQLITNTAKVTKGESYAYLSAVDTYDGANIDPAKGTYNSSRGTIAPGMQGVPEIIDLSKVTSFALRIATKDGTVENEAIKFAMKICMCKTDAPTSEATYALQAGDIKYFDANTGKAETITVDAEGNITLNKNIDGYFIIPITQFKDFTLELARTNWGGYVDKNYNNRAFGFTWKEGWANGKALYAGDIFFVEDAAKFQEFHCPHANKTTKTVAPTCQEEGCTLTACPDCGLEEKTDVKAKISCDTNGPEIGAKAPTCTEDGNEATKTCSMCGKPSEEGKIIAKLGHDLKVGEVVKPTCEADGYTVYTCQRTGCTYTENKDVTTKLGHDMKAGDVVKPTCEADGYTVYTCANGCGKTENKDVTTKLGHDMKAGEVVKPTCEKEGYTVYTCANGCGKTENKDATDKLAHELEKIETVAPTATEKGYDLLDCKNCDYTEKTNYVDALGSGDVDDDENNQGNEEDDENKSPETGDNNLFVMIMMIAALGAATVLFATKKRANR